MSELDHWVRALGDEYAPRFCFELAGDVLGLSWQYREKEIAGKPYVEFILSTLIFKDGKIKHYSIYACPKELVRRVEPFKRTRKESTLADLLHQLHAAFVGESRGEEE